MYKIRVNRYGEKYKKTELLIDILLGFYLVSWLLLLFILVILACTERSNFYVDRENRNLNLGF